MREELLRDADDGLINVAENDLLDSGVLEDLTDDTAIAATDGKYSLGIRMADQRMVGDHPLVPSPTRIREHDPCALPGTLTRIYRSRCTG